MKERGILFSAPMVRAILAHRATWARVPTVWDWRQAPEPCVRGVDDGPAAELEHAERLHLLGNGVVPLQAAYAFTILRERLVGTSSTLAPAGRR